MTNYHPSPSSWTTCNQLIGRALGTRKPLDVCPYEERFDVEEWGIDDRFMCMVCWFLVEEPRKCSSCKKKLFCQQCTATLKNCPNCRAEFTQERLSEEERSVIEAVSVACGKCKEVLKYGEREGHLEKCRVMLLSCPMLCGVVCGLAEMREHLHDECPRVQTRLRYSHSFTKVYMKTDIECEERVLKNIGYMARRYLTEPAFQTLM